MGWSLQNLSSLFSNVATDSACINTSDRLFIWHSVDRGLNKYFICFRHIHSLNILWWCPLVWFRVPLGIFGEASVSYFPVMILYSSIMSPLILSASHFSSITCCGPIVFVKLLMSQFSFVYIWPGKKTRRDKSVQLYMQLMSSCSSLQSSLL